MKILFIGDVVGKPGRNVVKYFLDNYLEKYEIDFVIANLENASHGKGLIKNNYLDMVSSGIDVVTMGNHYLAKKEILSYIDDYENLLRPANLNEAHPGRGSNVFSFQDIKIRVTNLMGRVFMGDNNDNPFEKLKDIIENDSSDIHIVDFHAEATGEKLALAWAFDGKVDAIVGTHTHVQTNDARLLKNGTFYISDVGMSGPRNGILGSSRDAVIKKSWTGIPTIFEIQEDDEFVFNAVILNYDVKMKKITSYQVINQIFSQEEIKS